MTRLSKGKWGKCKEMRLRNREKAFEKRRRKKLVGVLCEMSLLPRDSIKVIAESVGIENLNNDVATGLASDVEYRLREIIQVTPPPREATNVVG